MSSSPKRPWWWPGQPPQGVHTSDRDDVPLHYDGKRHGRHEWWGTALLLDARLDIDRLPLMTAVTIYGAEESLMQWLRIA